MIFLNSNYTILLDGHKWLINSTICSVVRFINFKRFNRGTYTTDFFGQNGVSWRCKNFQVTCQAFGLRVLMLTDRILNKIYVDLRLFWSLNSNGKQWSNSTLEIFTKLITFGYENISGRCYSKKGYSLPWTLAMFQVHIIEYKNISFFSISMCFQSLISRTFNA